MLIHNWYFIAIFFVFILYLLSSKLYNLILFPFSLFASDNDDDDDDDVQVSFERNTALEDPMKGQAYNYYRSVWTR
jgi:hypothetical protein